MKDNTFIIVDVLQTITILIVTTIASTSDTILTFFWCHSSHRCHVLCCTPNFKQKTLRKDSYYGILRNHNRYLTKRY